jgi:hypothetical protein
VESGAKLDMAILGPGFFSVMTPEGVQYTRNGQFMLDKSSRLVTMGGDPVMGKGGEITINVTDGKEILIESDGSIYLGKDLVDTIKVVEFKDMKGLKPVSKSNFTYTGTDAGETPKVYTVRQGSYETSNVNVVLENGGPHSHHEGLRVLHEDRPDVFRHQQQADRAGEILGGTYYDTGVMDSGNGHERAADESRSHRHQYRQRQHERL